MANHDDNRVFAYAELTALAGRFAQHAIAICNPARQDVANDLLLAARMAHCFGTAINHRLKPHWVRSTFSSCCAQAVEGHSS